MKRFSLVLFLISLSISSLLLEATAQTRAIRIRVPGTTTKPPVIIRIGGGGVPVSGGSSSGGSSSGGSSSSGVSPVPPASCSRVVDISSLRNVLYKPSNVHGGRGMTMLFQNKAEKTGKRKIQMRNCACTKTVGNFGLYADDYPYGERFYQQTGGSGNQVSEIIRKLGGVCMLVEGRGKWIKVANINNRSGSISK